MKRLIFASLVMALFSGTAAVAQNNGSYVDDVYYNGSQAQKDAKAEAKQQKKQQQTQQEGAEYYSSSNGYNDGYDGNAQVYNNSYGNDDNAYIDYDDDSYTSRIRRFYYPMASVGYWGGVYSPFWYDPFYSNPYYGWGGWYNPGITIGIGFGGPYWNNCWGMNTWFGYGGFSSWYYPYGGWAGGFGWSGGFGYGGGYWNGYYAGLYDAGRYGYGRSVNYGPRGARNGMMTVGSYGRSAGMRPMNGNGAVMQPMNGRAGNAAVRNDGRVDLNQSRMMNRDGSMQVEGGRGGNRQVMNNPRNFQNQNAQQAIRLNDRNAEFNQGNMTGGRPAQQQVEPVRRGGFFGNMFRGNGNAEMNRGGGMERSQPSRSYNVERAQPSRSFNMERAQPAPSRSFSSPAPARSSGGFGGGGGARMSGGRR